jgi:hypothetical protein
LSFEGDNGEFIQDIKGDTNSIDYGVMASLGYALGKARKGKGLYVQARYYHGFEDVYNNNISTGSNTASYFAIHLSLPFITEELANKNLKSNE